MPEFGWLSITEKLQKTVTIQLESVQCIESLPSLSQVLIKPIVFYESCSEVAKVKTNVCIIIKSHGFPIRGLQIEHKLQNRN